MELNVKKHTVVITVTVILTCLTLGSLFYLSEAITAHQELLREVKANREALETSQKALQHKMALLVEKNKNLPVTEITHSFYGISWQTIAIGVGIGVVVIGLMALGYSSFSPPTDPNSTTLSDATNTLSLVHDQIANLGNKGDSITLDRARSISLIEQRHDFLSELAEQEAPMARETFVSMDKLDENHRRLNDLLTKCLDNIATKKT